MPFDPDVNEIRISIRRKRRGRIIPLHRGKANCDERPAGTRRFNGKIDGK